MFTDLVNKARSWLGREKSIKLTDAVKTNIFNVSEFEKTVADAPALADLIDRLNDDYGYTHDLVQDLWTSFWKSAPEIRDASEMRESHLKNHAVVTAVANSPENVELRAKTAHDPYTAAMATLAVAEEVRAKLAEQDELAEKQEECEQASQQAEQDEAGASEALQAAESAESALSEAMGDFDGNGPLTQAQASAQAAAGQAQQQLQQQLEAAQASAESAAQTAVDAEALAQQVAQAMLGPVRDALQRALERTNEDQELLAAWGQGPGELAKKSFAERAALAAMLRGNRMARFAKMIGRFRFAADAQRVKKVEYARDEVVGTELSGDPNRILAGELAQLRSPFRLLRLIALSRLASGEMLSKRFEGRERIGQGALIVCVDNSESMTETDGTELTREAWAKAVALALLDCARRSKRDFVAINFSSRSQHSVWRFPKGEANLETTVGFCEEFFSGGTNFETPLQVATDILENEFNDAGKSRGDIVFVTDDDCAVTPQWMHSYRERKAKLNFRVFGIAVGQPAKPNGFLSAISDTVRDVVEFAEPDSVHDIMQVV